MAVLLPSHHGLAVVHRLKLPLTRGLQAGGDRVSALGEPGQRGADVLGARPSAHPVGQRDGQPEALAPIRPALVKGLPDYLRRSVKGDSAAEGLFFTFLSRLRDVGRLDDHELDAETAARALAAAVGEAERAFEQLGQPLPGIAAVVSNGRVMAALRRGHPLLVGVIDGLIPCARCEIGPGANELDPRVKSHRMLHAAMVLSGAASTDGFREVAEREVIAIPRSLTDVRSL